MILKHIKTKLTARFFIISCIYGVFSIPYPVYAYDYIIDNQAPHRIHIVRIGKEELECKLEKAYKSISGRQNVANISARTNATIGINAGFFQIGNEDDGFPSGTLSIKGQLYNTFFTKHPVIKILNNSLSIGEINPKIILSIGKQKFNISKVNGQPSKLEDIVLFTNRYSTKTLTAFNNRKELIFDKKGCFIKFNDHGNSKIEHDMLVISLPKTLRIGGLNRENAKLIFSCADLLNKDASYVSGLPILVKNFSIPAKVYKAKTPFNTSRHARTAIGIKENGDIIILVADHAYEKNKGDITLRELKNIVKNNFLKISIKYRKIPSSLNVKELLEILDDSIKIKNAKQGLTMVELAEYMKKLDCKDAINLDGGGSSALFIEGEVVNSVQGNDDKERISVASMRPVSNAIIFK